MKPEKISKRRKRSPEARCSVHDVHDKVKVRTTRLRFHARTKGVVHPRALVDRDTAERNEIGHVTWLTLCVCVCPPLDKGFSTATLFTVFPPLSTRRGQRDLQSWPLPTKLHTGRSGKRTCAVIPLHSSLLCFDAMVVHVPPPKPFPPQQRCS